ENTHEVVAVHQGEIIAHAGLTVLPPRAQASTSSAPGEGGIGYLLDPTCAGRELATEIAAELLHLAFEDLGLHRVVADTFAPSNPMMLYREPQMPPVQRARGTCWPLR